MQLSPFSPKEHFGRIIISLVMFFPTFDLSVECNIISSELWNILFRCAQVCVVPILLYGWEVLGFENVVA
jgi:hypothetical protein